MKLGTSRRPRTVTLAEHSPLRCADPRTKLALSLCASLAVMLPLERLVVFMGIYVLLLLWARLLPDAARQVWRLKWILITLFILDWVLVGLDLAVIVTLRIVLLAGAFALFVRTTTAGEFRLALEWLRVPYRYAFSVSIAFQSVGLLDEEWRAIREAQRARGAWAFEWGGWRKLVAQVRELVALTVPAVVLTTKRAWALTEAAYARGFDSPRRRSFRCLGMKRLDWLLLTAAGIVSVLVTAWRGVLGPLG
ncbi:MAG: energy-coupling factor transporter transmembrane component T [Anaerolineae bacterium]|jgi:energy-coupling factor transport system permease protein